MNSQFKSVELTSDGRPHNVVVPEEVSEDFEPLDKGDWWFIGITAVLVISMLAWVAYA